MRRQKRETTEYNECNVHQLYVGGRRRGDDSFPEKKVTFRFNHPRNPDADTRSRGVGSSRDFDICGVLEKEPRPAGRTSYQADRHGYLPEVKIEVQNRCPIGLTTEAPDQHVPRSQGPNSSRQKV
jgi:hypothetical protein